MNDDKFRKQFLKRLDIIIRLLVDRPQAGEPPKMIDVVERLNGMGLDTGAISSIVGKASNHVAALLQQRKKAKGRATK
jgi:hypothetical protein